MKLLVLMISVLITGLSYGGSGVKLKKAHYLSYSDSKVKVKSENKVYTIDNKIAMLAKKNDCKTDITVPIKSIIKVKKASKKQMKLKCISH